jgi:plasmid stabilization system protein ParE
MVQPHVGARARSTLLHEVRRIHLSRVRYYLFYRVTPDTIDILAFWHSSRGTDPAL